MNILLKGQDGSVAIMTLVEGANKEDAVQKFKDSHPEGFYIDYFEFNGKVPSDREFRDAWTHNGKNVVVDKSRAKDIHLARIRSVRNEALAELDKEQLKCITDPTRLNDLNEKKQILRDLPANIKNLDWPDELA